MVNVVGNGLYLMLYIINISSALTISTLDILPFLTVIVVWTLYGPVLWRLPRYCGIYFIWQSVKFAQWPR